MITTEYVVLTVARNEEVHIGKAIESVLSQTKPPAAFIIVDDGSTDRTPEIVKGYEDRGVKYFRLDDEREAFKGYNICKAVNSGYGLAVKYAPRWSYLLKLDADSAIPPDYAEKMVGYMMEDPSLGIVSGSLPLRNNLRGRPLDGAKLYRKTCWDAIGGMDYVIGFDTHALIKCGMRGFKAEIKPVPYMEMRSSRRETPSGWYYSGVTRFLLGFPLWHTMVSSMAALNDKPYLLGAAVMFLTHFILRLTKGAGCFSSYYRHHMRDFALEETAGRIRSMLHRSA